MPKHKSDIDLQSAAEEIKAIVRKYDIAASVILCSGNGHSEYVVDVVPTWSCLTLEEKPQGIAIRMKAQVKTAPAETRHRERVKLQRTSNMLVLMRETLMGQFSIFDRMVDVLKQHVNIEVGETIHTPGGEQS